MKIKRQIFNPFLPLWEYIPDGEPHVFGDRIYLFGSHDVEGGTRYCAGGDYVCWSAPVDDLTDWRCDGVIYEAARDSRVHGTFCDLYAPDVVCGNDGKYYLYYSLSGGIDNNGDDYNTAIGVAVADSPGGQYQYIGFVRNPDGTPFLKYLPADPAVINDDGTIRLYYGWALSMVASAAHGSGAGGGEQNAQNGVQGGQRRIPDFRTMDVAARRAFLLQFEGMLFHRSREQLTAEKEDVMGANHVVLADDMLTVISEPARIVPSQFLAMGTSFEGHGFYEASSIRKINGLYYFIYSDENSNMLSYATSKYPDRDFTYRGILQSNGDVGLNGRSGEDRLNMTANNHGSLVKVKDQWYIFYHRHTHNSTYSRQACAEKVAINADGSIAQAECTSCGLNDGALIPRGKYASIICCNLTNGKMPHATNRVLNADIPYITNVGEERFITNIKGCTTVVYKYFAFAGKYTLVLRLRGAQAKVLVDQTSVVFAGSSDWTNVKIPLDTFGVKPLTIVFDSLDPVDFLEFEFI